MGREMIHRQNDAMDLRTADLDRLRQKLLSLEPLPSNQFPTPSGTGSLPDAILIQRRDQHVRINSQGHSVDKKLFHGRFVLTLALSGAGYICVNTQTTPICPVQAALVYPFQYHHYIVNQDDFFWCVITFTLEHAFYPAKLYSQSINCSSVVMALLQRLVELYIHYGGAHFLVRQYLGCILGELELTAPDNTRSPETTAQVPSDELMLLERINGYICLHLGDRWLTPECLAETFHVSRSKLYLVFQKYLATCPAAYIRGLRLENACRMLQQTSGNLKGIAKKCGFSSQATFNRCFRREFGTAPGKYHDTAQEKRK